MSEQLTFNDIVRICRDLDWNSPTSDKYGKAAFRCGVIWSKPEQSHARDMFYAGHSIRKIAIVHGRDEGGIKSKLRSCGWFDDYRDGDVKDGAYLPQRFNYEFGNFYEIFQTKEETNMNPTTDTTTLIDNNKPIVEQVTMVRGQDVRKLKPKHLIDIIREIEAEIKDLSSFTVQSKYIAARLAQLQDDLTKVVEVLDTM